MNVLIVKMKNYLAPHHVVKHVLGLTFIFYIGGLLKALNEVDIVFAFWLCDSGKISYEKSSNEHSRELRYRTLDVWSHVLWFRCQLVEAKKTLYVSFRNQSCMKLVSRLFPKSLVSLTALNSVCADLKWPMEKNCTHFEKLHFWDTGMISSRFKNIYFALEGIFFEIKPLEEVL